MVEFEVASDRGFLGKTLLTAGNTEKYRLNFAAFLARGVVLTGATATVTSPTSTVAAPTLSDDQKALFVTVTSTLLVEVFTVALAVTTNDGQTLNYTAVFSVAGPIVLSSVSNPLPLIIGPTGPTGANGVSGTFTSQNGKTITVTNGLVTSIV
jgi:hypothetical protein